MAISPKAVMDDTIMIDDFEMMKNYEFYFPFNNITYYLHLMEMKPKD